MTSEGFAKYLDSLGSINRREVLIVHDQRATESNHGADANVEPVRVPPVVAIGDRLLDHLAADRSHPDLHQCDARHRLSLVR
jgi:hypothetical protein